MKTREDFNEKEAISWAWRAYKKDVAPGEFKELVTLFRQLDRRYCIQDLCWGFVKFKRLGMGMGAFVEIMSTPDPGYSTSWFGIGSKINPILNLIKRLEAKETE